jgi:ADP-ribose pyrophosphatase
MQERSHSASAAGWDGPTANLRILDLIATEEKPPEMPKTNKAAAKSSLPKKSAKAQKSKAKPAKTKLRKKKHLPTQAPELAEKAQIVSSQVVYEGPLFRVTKDTIIEPGGKKNVRDVVRHNGSVVIVAIDSSKSKKDPWIVMERQYRHAANQFLWELPAGKIDPGEDPVAGAQRELEEETGYRAKKWKPLVEYFASPGFLGESMKVFIAEGLVPGAASPEDDEDIEIRLVKLSEILKMIRKGAILDGKTLSCVLLIDFLQRKK